MACTCRLRVDTCSCMHSRISVVTMAGAAIDIDNASSNDTIQSVKERVFALNRTLYVRRQRLVYLAGQRGMDPLSDDETLGGAGVAQDGSAEIDVLLADLTAAEATELGRMVLKLKWMRMRPNRRYDCVCSALASSRATFNLHEFNFSHDHYRRSCVSTMTYFHYLLRIRILPLFKYCAINIAKHGSYSQLRRMVVPTKCKSSWTKGRTRNTRIQCVFCCN
jgi:hypothetical protein